MKNNLLFVAFSLFRFLTRFLPERLGYWLGRRIGILAYRLLPDRRRTAVENIRTALGLEAAEAEFLARESFASLGLLGAEFLRLSGRPALIRNRVAIDGQEHLRAALAPGKGALLLHAHQGNWELFGQAMALAGYNVHPIVQVQAGDHFYAVVDRQRREAGLMPITRGFTLREALRVLQQGHTVLIMPDQNAGRDGVIVPFFGRPASTPRGLAIIARLTDAPVVPAFIRRIKPGFHRISIHPAVDLVKTDDRRQDILVNLGRINDLLEQEIRECPEQWLWMHQRWKAKGKGGGRGGARKTRGLPRPGRNH